ncbi:hypothetical protein NECAME_10016 [Necator americanus]|uniref:Uncharacterized protein n=1 Tax=Necator americanus TaxID=51031 RepID=W2TBX3_NECAM|nr:hypothetical protein NECAME_10016 [Necator americanus]ETN79099.1 hypothetical protein NECAME_10016 [Necator americanus]
MQYATFGRINCEAPFGCPENNTIHSHTFPSGGGLIASRFKHKRDHKIQTTNMPMEYLAESDNFHLGWTY